MGFGLRKTGSWSNPCYKKNSTRILPYNITDPKVIFFRFGIKKFDLNEYGPECDPLKNWIWNRPKKSGPDQNTLIRIRGSVRNRYYRYYRLKWIMIFLLIIHTEENITNFVQSYCTESNIWLPVSEEKSYNEKNQMLERVHITYIHKKTVRRTQPLTRV